ncbi:hypothetical protein MRBLMR1_004894 [Neorhizobium sp. LMR1-1-1.1]
MGALEDGWLIAYEDNKTPPRPSIHGKLCVVQMPDGRNLVRKVQKAWKPGTWDLLTVSGEHMVNQRLIWAEPVTMIVPYELTDEERIIISEAAEKAREGSLLSDLA